ncbi:MAG: hypothetical protein ACP5UN_02105 [Candidatus Micrarchaeia archaeon]
MIYVNGKLISFDKKVENSNIDFISHAHSDHLSALKKSKSIIASNETIDLINTITNKNFTSIEIPKWIKLLDAGHILGSKQLVIYNEEEGKKIIYSGDYNMQKSLMCNPIEIEHADILIIDSTYYDPLIKFDNRLEVINKIKAWVKNNIKDNIIIFSAYALGKAQELIKILNEEDITPVVSKKICKINEVYKNHNFKLDYLSFYSDEFNSNIINDTFVGIVDNRSLFSLKQILKKFYKKNILTAAATGFAKLIKFNTDMQFPLSDHADFWQAIEYINLVNPKKILTYGNNEEIFAEYLKQKGYNASAFSKKKF